MRSLVRKMVAKGDLKTLFYQSRKIKVRVMRVLEAVERLAGTRAGQRPELDFRAESLEYTIRRAGQRLALGVTAGFTLLASALAATSGRVTGWAIMIVGITGLTLLVALAADLLIKRERPERASRAKSREGT